MDDCEQYFKEVQQKYLDVFKKYLPKLVGQISAPKIFERFVNGAYSENIVSPGLKDDIMSISGVSGYNKASRLMHGIDMDLRATTDHGMVQSNVLKICKILLTLDDGDFVTKGTAKEIMKLLNEVPEVVSVSIHKLEFEAFIPKTLVPFELFNAEGIIHHDRATPAQIGNYLLLYNLIVKAIAENSQKFKHLLVVLENHGGSDLAKHLTDELRDYNAIFFIHPTSNEGSVFGAHCPLSEAAPVQTRARIPSDVEKSINEMFFKYDELIFDIAKLFTKAIEQNPQPEMHRFHDIKEYFKTSRQHNSRRDEIESFTCVQEVIHFAAKYHTSVLDVKYLERLVQRYDIPEGQEKIDDYNSDLKKFKKNTKADLINDRYVSKAICTTTETMIVFTISKNLEEILMDEIKEIIGEMFEEELSPYVTLKVVSRTRSTTFTCFAPECFIQLLIMKAQKNLKTLIQDIGLMFLKIGYCTLLDYKPNPALEPVKIGEPSLKGDVEKPEKHLETIEKLKRENEELRKENRKHEDYTSIIQQRHKEKESLQKSLEEIRKERDEATEECESVKQKMEMIQEENDKLSEKCQLLEETMFQEQLKLKEEKESLQISLEEIKKERDDLATKFKQIQGEKDEATEECESVKQKLEIMGQDQLQLKEENDKWSEKCEMLEKMLKGKLIESGSERDKLEKHIQDSDKKLQDMKKENNDLLKDKSELQESLLEQKKNMDELEDQRNKLEVQCNTLEGQQNTLQAQRNTLEDQHNTLKNEFNKRVPLLSFYHENDRAAANYPPVAMVITNFSDHKKKDIQWFSPPFYSHKGGYKLSVKIDANGREGGQGTHLSASIHVMKGEYDDQLDWPLTAEVQLELLNRYTNSGHRGVTLRFDESSSRESRERVYSGVITDSGTCATHGICEERLIKHADLESQYFKDDSIFVRVNSVQIITTQPSRATPETPLHVSTEVHEFTLSNFSKVKAKNEKWKSKPFYTHDNGYKFVMVVYPNGEFTYKGSHIALFLHLMKGENDDQLSFPFRGTIYVQLVNRIGDHDHSEFPVKFNEENDPNGKHGARVTRYSADNLFEGHSTDGWGTASFIRHDLLPRDEYRKTEYLRNDELVFRIPKIEVYSS